MGNFSSFGFLSVGIQRWQKPKVLKCAAGFSLQRTYLYVPLHETYTTNIPCIGPISWGTIFFGNVLKNYKRSNGRFTFLLVSLDSRGYISVVRLRECPEHFWMTFKTGSNPCLYDKIAIYTFPAIRFTVLMYCKKSCG